MNAILRNSRTLSGVPVRKNAHLTAYQDLRGLDDTDEILSSFIENLKNEETVMHTPSPRFMRPSFEQIQEQKLLTNLDMKISLFSKDIVTTYNLFTTCLRANELDRAHALLASMYSLIRTQRNKTPMIDALNSYFLAWTLDPSLTVQQITQWFSDSIAAYNHMFDDRSYAILFDSVMSRSKTPQLQALLRMYKENCKRSNLNDILRHADVFKLENLKTLVQQFSIPKEEIPKDFREYFETEEDILRKREEEAKKLLREFSFENDQIPALEKNSENLKAVDTFGLKVIRHSIMALATKNKSEVLAEFATKLNASTPVDPAEIDKSSHDIDFFSIYKSLSKEDQKLFNAVLEEFNYERQLLVETRGLDSAKEKWRHEYENLQKADVFTTPQHVNQFLYLWLQELTTLIKAEVDLCKKIINGTYTKKAGLEGADLKAHKERVDYAPFITVVSPEKMAVITIMELLKSSSTKGSQVSGLRTATAVLGVGKAVEIEYNSQESLKSVQDKIKRLRLKKFFKTGNNKAKTYLRRQRPREENLDDPLLGWTHEVQAKLGSVLVSFLIKVAKVTVTATDPVTKKPVIGHVPAFHHNFQYISGTKVGLIKLQSEFAKKLSKEEIGSVVTPQGLPMLVKPKPWTSYRDGGYLTIRSLLLRSRNSAEQIAYLRAASDNKQLDQVFHGLNVLGETSWTVNKDIFKVVAKVWNTGEAFLEIPGISEIPNYPDRPAKTAPPEQFRNWKQEVQTISNEFGKNRSMRCDINYKLEIARAFLGEKFYFPHNLDFRGRAYPLSPHFNHLGNDLTRSLLIFWEGKELGPSGLDWLKVHMANLFGVDKVSLLDRKKFAEEHMEEFKKCCEDPLSDEGSLWKSADKPWQALATMFELVELSKLEDPSKFISHQPVHQDGTCNGLQHYAALGGDVAGAKQVNLIPQDKPGDVYSFVASLVQKRVDLDVLKGVEEAIKILPHIKRKVVKQTVMTNVYGVTFVGAKDQIAKQLVDVFPDNLELSVVSNYLTKQVFASIRELFEGAHMIQDWLGEAAKIISKSFYLYDDEQKTTPIKKPDYITSVVWTTPLGLPIVQPYRSVSKRQVQTNLQSVFISDPYSLSSVDSKKQLTALPPNFVHSLDATHMLKSSISCGNANISFAAVHDSYWTHASDIETMNKILRNEFVNLYQIDIIKKLKEEFETRYLDYVQLVQINKASPIAGQLTTLKKHFEDLKQTRLTIYDELYLEVERRKLLRSSNPEEVQAGKEMVTTVSFFDDVKLDDFRVKKNTHATQVLAPFKLPEIPVKGDLDIECVRDSPYFFS